CDQHRVATFIHRVEGGPEPFSSLRAALVFYSHASLWYLVEQAPHASPVAPMQREIQILSPDGQTRIVPLEGQRISLGRSSITELCYPDDSGLSRQHLAFEQQGDQWTIRDLGSK